MKTLQKITLLIVFCSMNCHTQAQTKPADVNRDEQQESTGVEIESNESASNKVLAEKKNPHAHLPQHEIIVGQALPALKIEEYGEVIIVDDVESRFQPWSADKPLNRVHVIHYLAGRRSASKRHKNFSDQLEALQLDFAKHHVTTIINADDAFFGTSKLVAGRLDNSKRNYPNISVVGDKTGIGAHTWSLKRKGSAIIIIDSNGIVLFFKQDKFSQQEIDSTLELLQSHMNP